MPHDLLTDTTIAARYRIDRMLGSGGMARVYAAHDELLGRPVAVKVLRDRFASDAAFAERFRREARSAASLHHPNIVQVFDCAPEDAGPAYIVMELIDGPSLRDLLDTTGPLPEARAASLVMQAARGLGHAHAHGVVHRDVKPENMLLDAHGTLRVADFGIARLIDSGDTLTEVGSVVGTARYLSPEQARGERVTPASDVYALGVVLYELLTGRTPFAGDNAIEVALLQVQSEPVPPGELRPGLTPRLEAIVLQALCKEPGERFATATELADALAGDSSTATTEVLAGVAPTVRMASGVEPTAVKTVLAGQPRARPTWQRALVVAVALIGLALAGAYLVRGDATKRASAKRSTPPAAGAAAPRPLRHRSSLPFQRSSGCRSSRHGQRVKPRDSSWSWRAPPRANRSRATRSSPSHPKVVVRSRPGRASRWSSAPAHRFPQASPARTSTWARVTPNTRVENADGLLAVALAHVDHAALLHLAHVLEEAEDGRDLVG